MKTTFYAIFPALFLLSCDAARRINMENKSSGDAEITWKIKEDSLTSSPLYISNSQTVNIALKNSKPHNKAKMSVGIGSWSGSELTKFVNDIEWLQIKWNGGVILLDSTQRIYNYLSARRTGLDNSKINIIVK